MDTCPQCEKIILSDYKFCPRCGFSLYGEPPVGTDGQNETARDSCDSSAVKFFNVAQNLSTADNIDQLLEMIGKAVEELLNAERSSIMLLDESGKNLFFKTATGEEILKKLKVPVGKGIAGWIAQNKKPDIVNAPYNDSRFSSDTDKATGFKTRSIVGAPMIAGNELIGVAEAINKRDGDFTQDDMEMLIGFAGLAAVSIVNTRLKTDQGNLFLNLIEFLVMGSESLGNPEPTMKGHAWEMARFALEIGKELEFSVEKQQLLQNAAFVHDIGFLGLENTELVGIKIEQELNDSAKYRLHPIIGAEMVKGIKIMQNLIPFIKYHHRYKNGEGFPENIPTEDITPEIEVISILEDYLSTNNKEQVNQLRYSKEVYDAFMKSVP